MSRTTKKKPVKGSKKKPEKGSICGRGPKWDI